MKKIFIVLAILAIATTADAKIRLGVKGGLNFASLSFNQQSLNDLIGSRTGWHAGVMMNVGLPLGLSLQPEILYSSKGMENGTIGYVEVPVDLQWGFKIAMFRPYVSLTPYVSYKTNSSDSFTDLNSWDGGIGLGAGVDVWKLQVSVKYMWGLGKVMDITPSQLTSDLTAKNRNIMLSLGFFL